MKVRNILHWFFGVDGATSLPIGICVVVFLLNLFNGMAVTNLSSYLPQLVKEFNVSEVNAGEYAGIVTSSLSVSRIVSSIMWGFICDKFGRKVSLLWTGYGLAISTLIFGFNFNYIWAVVSRSLQGLCMGLIVITKAVVSDIADDESLALGLSLIFSANNIGYIIGPSMAGFLVFPTEKYPKIFAKGGFFGTFKVLLPNLIIAAGLLFVLLMATYLLPKKTNSDLVNGESVNSQTCIQSSFETTFTSTVGNYTKSDEKPLLHEKTSGTTDHLENESKLGFESKVSVFSDLLNSKYGRLLTNKHYVLSITLYALFSMTTVGYEDLFPVFAATKIKYNGLGMSTSDIGLLYLITGLAMIFIQFTIINKVINKFGSKKIFSVVTFFFCILVFLLPTDAKIKDRKLLWIALWLTQCLMRSMYSAGILCVNIFINNSVEPEQFGMANGLGLSLASFGRSIGSLSFGLAYSWSMKNVKKSVTTNKSLGFPFNEYFAFILIALSSLLVILIAVLLPESINKKKALT